MKRGICVSCGKPTGKEGGTLSLHLGDRRVKLDLCDRCDKNRGSLDDEHVAKVLRERQWDQVHIDTVAAQVRTIKRKIQDAPLICAA